MAYNSYTTTQLVDNIVLTSHIPESNNTFTPGDLINLSNRELQTAIMKQIISTRGGYYLTYRDYALTQDNTYPIPSEAIAGAVDNVEILIDTVIIQCALLEEAEQTNTQYPNSTTYGFYIRGNTIQILPSVNSIGHVRVWYLRRPSQLIPTSEACQIQAIDSSTPGQTTFSVASVPSNITMGSFVDLLQDQPTFNILEEDLEITDIQGTDITVNAEVLPEVGDWIALHNQTPIPQIPVEFRPLLEQRVVCKVYELQGYLDKLAAAKKVLEEMQGDTLNLITPRVKNRTKVLIATGGVLGGVRGRIWPTGREH